MWGQEDEDDLAKKHGGIIYRVKGVVYTKESEFAHWLQGVVLCLKLMKQIRFFKKIKKKIYLKIYIYKDILYM